MKPESLDDKVRRAKARWLKRVMMNPSATSTQKCLAHAIADRLNCVTLDCWAAQPTLARDIGVKSVKTVVRAGRGLQEVNLIRLKRTGDGPGLRYAPVFMSGDMDRPVARNGQRCPTAPDTDGRESFLGIHTESFSTGQASATTDAAPPKQAFNPKQRGAIEIELAELLGTNGLELLARLAIIDEAILERLCKARAEGSLSERDLAAARLAAEQTSPSASLRRIPR